MSIKRTFDILVHHSVNLVTLFHRFIRLGTTCALLAIAVVAASPQDAQREQEKERREKLRTILETQDLRTPHDGKLVSYLSDADPVVRRRATLAYGSIQDSGVIGPLTHNLTDPDPAVQSAAAFALGQIGMLLSPTARQDLEYDLIWKRLPQILVPDRLIEEIGKFGTETGLNDLMVRYGSAYNVTQNRPLTMCIARFAIRGIVNETGVHYLLRFIRPADNAPWEVVYALQRIGDHPRIREEIEAVVQLCKSPDPLVRMHVATLLGKIRDERSSLEPLARLARFDTDWRVRVNAYRALGGFPLRGHDEVLADFKQGFFDDNEYVSEAALNAFGNSGIDNSDSVGLAGETLYQLRYIAENRSGDFAWYLQGEAAMSLAKLLRASAEPSIHPDGDMQPPLHAALLQALANTGTNRAMEQLLAATSDESPQVACAALEGLRTLLSMIPPDTGAINRAYVAVLNALHSEDAVVIATAASLLAEPPFVRDGVVDILLTALQDLRSGYDLDAILEIIGTLKKLNDPRAVPALREQFNRSDPAIASAAASALSVMTGTTYTPRYLQPGYVDLDFEYLDSLPETILVSLQTIRGDVTIELTKSAAPFTVMNFLKLSTRRGLYRGTTFHRVVPNFVVQGGDPRGDGWGGPGYSIRSEFSPSTFGEGVLGMASSGKDTEGSQFFITQSPQPHLDGRYTIFGRVVSGMDVINRIRKEDRLFDIKVSPE